MTQDISGFGTQIRVIADTTFPTGFTITQFADDADAIDNPATVVGDKAMGLNGDLITWSKATPLDITLNVISGSDDDANLSILLDANLVGAGRVSAQDVITLTILYPDGSSTTYSTGKVVSGPTTSSVAAAGRKKTKAYAFSFETKSGIA